MSVYVSGRADEWGIYAALDCKHGERLRQIRGSKLALVGPRIRIEDTEGR